jgi:alpha-beta hydrolase superfamily lysophospholipase
MDAPLDNKDRSTRKETFMTDLGDALVSSKPVKLAMAGPRTGAYLWHSLNRPFRLGQQRNPAIPTYPTTAGMAASVLIDELTLACVPFADTPLDGTYFSRVRTETDQVLALMEKRGWLLDPASYHEDPSAPARFTLRPARFGRIRYEALSFQSGYTPPAGVPGAERWTALGPNSQVRAFVLRHRGKPRPWLVNLHGFMMGEPSDLLVMRAMHWFVERGFNVIMPTAPLHGPRGSKRRHAADLISLDYVSNLHGMSQAVSDIRRCVGWAFEQGAPRVVLHGASLGGYLAALVAALDDRIDRVVVGMPLVDIASVGDRYPLRAKRLLDRYGLRGERAALVHRVISPVAMPCRVEHDQRYIYAGVADRWITPGQVYQLWNHWEQPQTLWHSGSHMTDWTGQARLFHDEAIGLAHS